MNYPHQPPLSSRVDNVDAEAWWEIYVAPFGFRRITGPIRGGALMSAIVRVRPLMLPSVEIYEGGIEPDLMEDEKGNTDPPESPLLNRYR